VIGDKRIDHRPPTAEEHMSEHVDAEFSTDFFENRYDLGCHIPVGCHILDDG
jgi:hypothetical protein